MLFLPQVRRRIEHGDDRVRCLRINMSEYESNVTYEQVAHRLGNAKRVMITTHAKPDGDAVGSTLALARALANRGQTAEVFWMGPVESSLLLLTGDTKYQLVEKTRPQGEYDAIVITDTGAWTQLEPLTEWLKPQRERIIVIDHHARGDDVAAMRIVDARAASSTQVLARLLDEMRCEVTPGVGGIAEALFLGLATDTGWFKYESARSEAFALAARLLAYEVDKSRLYQIVEENYGPPRLALEARALGSLTYACGGAVAIQTLGLADFKETGARPEDLTGLVNTPMTVGAVRVSILISQSETGLCKISFRSKPAAPGKPPGDFVDVNVLAQQFNGGGHKHAAGAKLSMEVDQAKARVIAAAESAAASLKA
jgi:phosphoesterase RecJ-like protein